MVHSIEAKTESGTDVLLVHLEAGATVGDLQNVRHVRAKDRPVLFTRAGVLSPAVREELARSAAASNGLTALVENNAALRPMTAYLLRSLGASRARVCKTQEEALRWIDSRPSVARDSSPGRRAVLARASV